MGIDVGADNEADNVKEWHPCLFWEELLRECERKRRDDPADFHHAEETSLDRSLDLVESARTSNEGHRRQINDVLNWRDL